MEILCTALWVYSIILLVRVILSWVTMAGSPPMSMNPVLRVIYELTDPVLDFFRRLIPPLGPLDISPLIVFLIIGVIQRSIC